MNELISKIEREKGIYIHKGPFIFIGSSKLFKEVLNKTRIYANCDEDILIYGEIGTGKTELAKALHCLSSRRDFPFVQFDCGLLDESLAESELFGHKKGAFTGAIENRIGLLESADNGTFLLDEVGNLPLNLQVKFLRVTQDKQIRRVGDNKEKKINVRIISATNKKLKRGVKEGWFTEDLFSRIDVLVIEIPPLRERKEDIIELVDHKLFNLNRKYAKKKKLSREVHDYLLTYSWPENVRELNNVITKAFFDSSCNMIGLRSFPEEIKNFQKRHFSEHDSNNSEIKSLFMNLIEGKTNFMTDVHQAYLNRDLNRSELRELIRMGLQYGNGKFKDLSMMFNCDYDRLMGFIRHHDLKPKKAGLEV
jgi:transcriptional regulator with GAF, ATPase, and Fis domain